MEIKEINEMLEFYYQEKIKIHIILLDKHFLNGFLTSHPKDNVWFMTEDRLGENTIVFVNNIESLQQFRRKE